MIVFTLYLTHGFCTARAYDATIYVRTDLIELFVYTLAGIHAAGIRNCEVYNVAMEKS